MANVATHILLPILLAETYRRYISKTKLSKWYVFFAGLVGAMPDFDLFYTLYATGSFNLAYHRTLTHSLFLPMILTTIGLIIYALHKKKILTYDGWKIAYRLLFFGSFGLVTHTLLDGIDGLSTWFYPFVWSIDLPNLILNKFRAGILDGILLLTWLLYDKELLADLLSFFGFTKN